MEITTDASFGIIPLQYVEGEWFVFLVEQYNARRGDRYWTFPKGHAEPGESPLQTAVRELTEETTLVPAIVLEQPGFPMQYTFIHEGIQTDKTVTYFLGLIAEPQFQIQASELAAATWHPLETASEQLSFPNLRALCQRVVEYIGTRPVSDVFPNYK